MEVRKHLFKGTLAVYNRALDAYSLRQEVASRNIANAQTPNYKPESVRFEETFQEAQKSVAGMQDNERHIPIGPPAKGAITGERTEENLPFPERFFTGQAHVNVDQEMAQMAENQIRFRFASKATSGYFQKMNSAIKGMTI